MPQTLCHGDFCYPNAFDCRRSDGEIVTGVIDWQYAGIRQIGSDIAGFIADSSVIPVRRKAAEPEELMEIMLEEYLRGIEESGWKGDIRQVRFACLTYLALPWTFNQLPGLNARVLTQKPTAENRASMEQLVEKFRKPQEFLLDVMDEARRLMDEGI
jgi:hypothetical protein